MFEIYNEQSLKYDYNNKKYKLRSLAYLYFNIC